MEELAVQFWKGEDISKGVRVLTWATAIRWIGWGFAESLIPVFLFAFAGTYAQAGLLRSSYDIAFFVAMPLAGVLADRTRATTLVMIGLSLYVFVGTGYLLAGVTSLAVWIVVARVTNGIGYAFDAVGRETYFRRHSPKEKLATVFGYFDTISNFWWIAAAFAGIILVKYISSAWLLFLITPTVLISMFMVWRFSRTEVPEHFSKDQMRMRYRELLREFSAWSSELKLLTMFNFFVSSAYAVVLFFLPIQVYHEGVGFTPVIIIGIVSTIPTLGGWVLGKWFDRYGSRVFVYGLIIFAILLGMLAVVTGYLWQIIISFAIGIVMELLSVGSNELLTLYANPEHFGRMDGITRSISDIGSMVGPLVIGIVIDASGTGVAYLSLSLLMFALAAVFVVGRKYLKREQKI